MSKLEKAEVPAQEVESVKVSGERSLIRDVFRNPLQVQHIHSLPDWMVEPGYHYRLVITTYKNRNNQLRLKQMESNGWQVVYSEGSELDERANAPESKSNFRKSPLFVDKTSGHKAVWMRIPDENRKEIDRVNAEARKQKLMDAVYVKSHRNNPRGQTRYVDKDEFVVPSR